MLRAPVAVGSRFPLPQIGSTQSRRAPRSRSRLLLLPMRFRSKDAARDAEGLWVEFEHRDVRKVVLVGVEEFVVVDIVALPEDPLSVRAEERLRRFALDGVAERLLPLVRIGQVKLVE